MAAVPKFYASGAVGNLSLTTSYQTITTGGSIDSDIVVLSATNESSTSKTITFADESDNLIGSVLLPASAGQTNSNPPINLMQPGFGMMGLEPNPFGGYSFFLPSGIVLKAKVNSVTGGAARIYWKRKDY